MNYLSRRIADGRLSGRRGFKPRLPGGLNNYGLYPNSTDEACHLDSHTPTFVL